MWLKSAMNQVMEDLENERWNNLSAHDPSLSVRLAHRHLSHFPLFNGERSLNVSVSFRKGTADLEREEDEEETEDSGEVLDDSSSSPSSTLKNYPLTCKVLYSYKVGSRRLNFVTGQLQP